MIFHDIEPKTIIATAIVLAAAFAFIYWAQNRKIKDAGEVKWPREGWWPRKD